MKEKERLMNSPAERTRVILVHTEKNILVNHYSKKEISEIQGD